MRRHNSISALAVFLTFAGATAFAQYPVANQDGRLFDNNPSPISRYNGARPASPMIGGNAFASGNVRGLSLRSSSPISDPTAFRAPLGSATLYNFRRDSMSTYDLGNPTGRAYFDPATTAATVGYLKGGYGTAGSLGPRSVPGLVQPRGDQRLDFAAADTGPRPGIINNQATVSSLFSPRIGLPSPSDRVQQQLNDRLEPFDPRLSLPSSAGPIDVRMPADPTLGSRPPLGTPLELVMRGGPQPLGPTKPTTETTGVLPRPRDTTDRPPLGIMAPPPTVSRDTPRRGVEELPVPVDASMLPGANIFNDMQMAIELKKDPRGEWYEKMRTAARDNPTLAPKLNELAQKDSETFVKQMLDMPIRTFVGSDANAVNDALLKAEASMAIGNYVEAAERYDAAYRMGSKAGRPNPLPLIGRANALIAAGMYSSAIDALLRAVEQGPEIAQFNLDLVALVGGIEIIDVRRADLRKRLADGDDTRLRFLLAYIEYYGGYRDEGLKNFEQAAELDRGMTIISRFPRMLSGEELPAPSLRSPSFKPAANPRDNIGPGNR